MARKIAFPDELLEDAWIARRNRDDRLLAFLLDMAKEEGYTNPEILRWVFGSNRDAWRDWREVLGISSEAYNPIEELHGFTSTYARGCRCSKCWDARERYLQKRKGWV